MNAVRRTEHQKSSGANHRETDNLMSRKVGRCLVGGPGVVLAALALWLACGKDSPTNPAEQQTPAPPPPPVATSITVTPSSHTLSSIGATVQLAAVVRDQNNNVMTGQMVTWTSANTAVATVSAQGLATAAGNGTAQVTARSGNASGTSSITVSVPVPTSITVTPSSHTLSSIGATVQLAAVVRDQNNNVMTGQMVTWTSANTAVATVSAQGLATAAGNGMVDIMARSDDLAGSATVTVSQEPASIIIEVDLDSTRLTEIGQTLLLSATVRDANDVPIEEAEVTWSSSDDLVASVAGDGLVTAVGDGTADITATSGDVSRSVTITVMVPTPDRDALVALYEAANGSNWRQNDNWLSDRPLDEWFGVSVSAEERVDSLSLRGNGLSGLIPPELSALDNLKVLDLARNALSGSIPPELGTLGYLSALDLHRNALSGSIPAELGGLGNLRVLYLHRNALSGSIPAELGGLGNLSVLSLYLNDLSGSIPIELGGLGNLTVMDLGDNALSGSIPPELGRLGRLRNLDLSRNALSGSIPPESGDLSNLEELHLWDNNLSGSIPPDLGNLSNLVVLYLYLNDLSGSIPSELGRLGNLEELDLGDNALSGSIPSELGRLGNLVVLYLYLNDLSGSIPSELGRLGNLEELDFGDNALSGSVPSELGSLGNLEELYLPNNPDLDGPLPAAFTGLTALTALDILDTGLCAPSDEAFQVWLRGVTSKTGVVNCEPAGSQGRRIIRD